MAKPKRDGHGRFIKTAKKKKKKNPVPLLAGVAGNPRKPAVPKLLKTAMKIIGVVLPAGAGLILPRLGSKALLGEKDTAVLGPLAQATGSVGLGWITREAFGTRAGMIVMGTGVTAALIRIAGYYIPQLGVQLGEAEPTMKMIGPSIPLRTHLAIVNKQQQPAAQQQPQMEGYIDERQINDALNIRQVQLQGAEDDYLQESTLGGYYEMDPLSQGILY